MPRASSALASFAASPVFDSPKTKPAEFVGHPLRLDQRIGDELAVHLQRRNDVGEHAHAVRLVRRERLAQHAGRHRALDADDERQEVGGAADRRRAVLGTGLAEAREVLRDREVAGHPDLLATADAHPVDAADHRLVAGEDPGDHVVEQAHVLPVLLRMPGVVLGVLLGVAAGAEGLVAGAGEDDAVDVARVRRGAEREDHALHHVGGVGVELRRVVERDPGVEEARRGLAVGRLRRPLLVANTGLRDVVDEVVVLELAHGGPGVGGVHGILHCQAGTSTTRLVISRWWTAANTRLMSSSGCRSTNGLIATLPSSTRSSAAG